ncbi:alpha/beta fold hydrolase [Halegenticoccus soli]|uniref:alpha/beta fold hydrolase n=1 Tax=Halegenticoccus soli TaxID=1985678 RepID=UPI000C6E4F76|nr:alpha/beta hydrolase [Halegenticoccus soli]
METITSADGTPIAFERTGSGPPLVLVHGSAGDHTRWELSEVRSAFAEHFTVYAVDRRGRGESGDAAEYELEREFEDVAAVVGSIDDPVVLLGHSYGALCCLEAALRTDNLRKLVLYEPPLPVGDHELYSEDVLAELAALLDDGENERALVLFLREVAEIPPAEIDVLRSAPNWPDRVAAARTLPRETRAPAEYEFDAARFADLVTPTLLLSGGESPKWFREATDAVNDALPNSRITILDGQQHVAMNTAPDLFIDEVLTFVREAN